MRSSSYLALSLSRSGSLLSTTSPAAAAPQEPSATGAESKPFAKPSFRDHQKQFRKSKLESILRRSSASESSSTGNLHQKKPSTTVFDANSSSYHISIDLPNQIHIKHESKRPTMKRENNENFNTINAGGRGNNGFIKRATDALKAAQVGDQANEDLAGIVLEVQAKGQAARTDRRPNVQSVRSTLGKQSKGENQKNEVTGIIVLDDLKKKLGQANQKA